MNGALGQLSIKCVKFLIWRRIRLIFKNCTSGVHAPLLQVGLCYLLVEQITLSQGHEWMLLSKYLSSFRFKVYKIDFQKMYKWGTIHVHFELLAIYVLNESFLSTINDMNDLYIRTTFRLCRVLFKIDYFFHCTSMVHYLQVVFCDFLGRKD